MNLIKYDEMSEYYDIVVVGAGPAGLSAAVGLSKYNRSVVVIDSGKSLLCRDRNAADDIADGYGGAGLFSDGKFSFYPSASELWKLPHKSILNESYKWMKNTLEDFGMRVPAFPKFNDEIDIDQREWSLKKYPSQYLSLEDRYYLTEKLVQQSSGECVEFTQVSRCEYDYKKKMFRLQATCKQNGKTMVINSSNIIFSTGRFGSISLLKYNFVYPSFRRMEIGFRIQQKSEKSFFYDFEELDPKYRFAHKGIEWRTFCACRDGETVITNCQGMYTVSGRSDGQATNLSNIGFNSRIYNEVNPSDCTK